MKLHGKRLLMIVTDGVEIAELTRFRAAFESEYAEVFLASPFPFLQIDGFDEEGTKEAVLLDFSLDTVQAVAYDGVIVPAGMLQADLLKDDPLVHAVLQDFHRHALPIFVSGEAIRVLHGSALLSEHILVRDGDSVGGFIERMVGFLLDGSSSWYRAGTSATIKA